METRWSSPSTTSTVPSQCLNGGLPRFFLRRPPFLAHERERGRQGQAADDGEEREGLRGRTDAVGRRRGHDEAVRGKEGIAQERKRRRKPTGPTLRDQLPHQPKSLLKPARGKSNGLDSCWVANIYGFEDEG
jgi:hypothetical protein